VAAIVGEMAAAEELIKDGEKVLESVVEKVEELCSVKMALLSRECVCWMSEVDAKSVKTRRTT
jgi:hypothetical protein